ncbi:formylglycine-generating enzyme family protein [Kangiella shandongensis]|uniref:formylglycine-generating enzyme family protein n=1 Tax=Kangiella shandongensis TaxID=2763258 RepID=UPI001CBD8593|nr:formylglycine-generating enzyme family protein [Kangiella shandongensis]
MKILSLIIATVSLALAGASEQVLIEGGEYRPLYMSEDSPMQTVSSFYLDQYPVTNQQYLEFVEQNPQWRKTAAPSIFVEQDYLKHWDSDESFEAIAAESPVTYVSWFAADAYCQSQGKRLPKVAEWELAALASETQANGSLESGYKQQILTWYSKPSPKTLPSVGGSPANYWGVHDLHGLVWEWTEDFNSTLVTGESREDSTIDTKLFCAGGASGAVDPGDYAAFMRYGFRSSLEAKFTLSNLGFRCASDMKSANGD